MRVSQRILAQAAQPAMASALLTMPQYQSVAA
jgi:hypothetical protein